MNQQTFASYTGIGTASLSSIFTGRTRPTLNHVDAILEKFPNVNPMWLLKGTGGMLLSADDKKASDESTSSSTNGAEGTTATQQNSANPTSANLSQEQGQQRNAITPNTRSVNTPNFGSRNATSFQFEAEKKTVLPQRKITEIRVFYDDQTWESFVPKKEK